MNQTLSYFTGPTLGMFQTRLPWNPESSVYRTVRNVAPGAPLGRSLPVWKFWPLEAQVTWLMIWEITDQLLHLIFLIPVNPESRRQIWELWNKACSFLKSWSHSNRLYVSWAVTGAKQFQSHLWSGNLAILAGSQTLEFPDAIQNSLLAPDTKASVQRKSRVQRKSGIDMWVLA